MKITIHYYTKERKVTLLRLTEEAYSAPLRLLARLRGQTEEMWGWIGRK